MCLSRRSNSNVSSKVRPIRTRLPSASTRKFSSSSIIASTEHKPDTDQRILDLNLTDQGYRVAHVAAGPPPKGGPQLFYECEMDHIWPRNPGALSTLPGGASRF